MLDTTAPSQTTRRPANTGTTGSKTPQGWRIALVLAAFVAIGLAAIWIVAGLGDAPDVVTDRVSGFEYTTNATPGHSAALGVTSDYFGNSGELWPETGRVSGFEYTTNATPGHSAAPGVTSDYFGYNPELNPDR